MTFGGVPKTKVHVGVGDRTRGWCPLCVAARAKDEGCWEGSGGRWGAGALGEKCCGDRNKLNRGGGGE
eukprot:741132-Hanusia_phi.AAC.1